MSVQARGTVQLEGGDLWFALGDGQRLLLDAGSPLARLRQLAASAAKGVLITGVVERAGTAWRLHVARVAAASP